MTNLDSFAKFSRERGVLALYFLILPFSLAVALAPALWGGKTLLPADQLNTMMLPYSAKYDSVEVYNHFLTDAIAQVYPYKVRWRANALRGEFVSWNPMIFGGHPHYASTSFTHFDPTNLVLLLGEMPAAYHWQMALKLLIAGVGMWVLLGFFRVEGAALHGAVRAMFAAAYMLNSLFITTLQHQWLVGTFAWTPFAAYFLLRSLERLLEISRARGFFGATLDGEVVRRGAFAAFFLALACFSGSLQTNAIGILALIALTLGVALYAEDESPARRFSRSAVVLAGVGALAFALSAAMWLPSLELFAYNENARAEGKIFSLWNSLKSLPLLASFVVPELIGSPRGFDLAKIAQADMNDFNAFLGFAPFAFACVGSFALWNNSAVESRWTRPFILLTALGLLIPLATPLYKFIYHRSFILYALGMTVVGAQAAHYIVFSSSWRNSSSRQISARRVFRALALFLAIVVCGLILVNVVLALRYDAVYAQMKAFVERNLSVAQLAGGSAAWMLRRIDVFLRHYSWQNPQIWLAVVVPALALALARFLAFGAVFRSAAGSDSAFDSASGAHERRRLWALWALCGLTVVQLWTAAYSWLPMVDMERFPLYPPTRTTDFLRKDSSLHRFLPLFDAASHRVMQPNINDMYGIACVQGYESIFARPAAQIAGTLSQPPSAQQLRLGGLANVKYYVASAKNPYSHEFLRLVDSGATLIYENLLAEPRAYMRYRSRTVRANEANKLVAVPDRETYARIFTEDTSFAAREVLLHEDSPIDAAATPLPLQDSAPTPRHAIRVLAYENNRVKLEVETERAGWCVLADSYYPGWKARVNGAEARIYRANYAVRAVAVPAGKSVVEFRFEPDTFRVGAWISGAGAAALCLLGALGGRFKKEGGKLRREKNINKT